MSFDPRDRRHEIRHFWIIIIVAVNLWLFRMISQFIVFKNKTRAWIFLSRCIQGEEQSRIA